MATYGKKSRRPNSHSEVVTFPTYAVLARPVGQLRAFQFPVSDPSKRSDAFLLTTRTSIGTRKQLLKEDTAVLVVEYCKNGLP